jgi:hypothetical protein
MPINSASVPQLLVTEKQAAKALAISPRKLWSIRNAGEITYLRSGSAVRYDVDDLRAWIERNKLPVPSVN